MVHKGSKLAFIPLSRLIPEPRPFSHHVLVMSCEAKVRANAWSYLEGGDQESESELRLSNAA